MQSVQYAGFAVAAVAAASFLSGIQATQAEAKRPAHRHDGIYTVRIVTHHGSCHKTYTTNVAISGSQIHATGHALVQGSGRIDASDRVVVTLRLLHHAVHVTGRMHDHSGSGRWSSQGLDCRGSWHATRRG